MQVTEALHAVPTVISVHITVSTAYMAMLTVYTAVIQVNAEDMVAKEAQRLEVMKRRQERELNQMVAYEMMRKEMQVSTQRFVVKYQHV